MSRDVAARRRLLEATRTLCKTNEPEVAAHALLAVRTELGVLASELLEEPVRIMFAKYPQGGDHA